MWKILVGFVVFAAAVLYILNKSGGDIDMGGEKHSVEAPHAAEPAKAADAPASAAMAAVAAAASAAAMPASGASATK